MAEDGLDAAHEEHYDTAGESGDDRSHQFNGQFGEEVGEDGVKVAPSLLEDDFLLLRDCVR